MNGRSLIPGKPLPPSEIADYSLHRDTLDEIFTERFRLRLERIAALVRQSGEPLEGNIFYADLADHYADQPPDRDLAPARRNVWRAVRFKERLLEVGVNAGHSALLALSANPRLEYYGVDIMGTPIRPNASISSKASSRGGCTCSPAIPATFFPGSSTGAPNSRSTSFMSTGATPTTSAAPTWAIAFASRAASAAGMFCSTTSMRAGSSMSIANSCRGAI